MDLKLRNVDLGFCRVYYRNSAGGLYCFQSTFRDQFALYLCTTEGEPSHEVSLAARTLDRLPEPNCKLTKDFAAFVAARMEICL